MTWASYTGMKLSKMWDEQVVRSPFVLMLSLMAPGIPASGLISWPAAIMASTLAACFRAFSLSSVT